MSIATPITKPTTTFNTNDFKSFVTMCALTMSAQKIMKFFYEMQISKEARSWAWSMGKHTNEKRSEALKKIKSFQKNQNLCYLYSDLTSENEIPFELKLQNLQLSSLPPFSDPLKITEINLNSNQFLDLSQLMTLENITHLYLSHALQTQSIDLSVFEKLQVVNLEANEIQDLEKIKVPKHKIRIVLDRNLIQTIPLSWLEIHPESEISLYENPLQFSMKKQITDRSIKMLGPKFSVEVEKIDHSKLNLENIPLSIKFFDDGIFVINLRFNKIEQIPETILSSKGLYFIDLRNNPLDYETKSKIKKIQRDCKKDSPLFPLILFDQHTKNQKIPTQEKFQKKFLDFESLFKLYQEQVRRDS